MTLYPLSASNSRLQLGVAFDSFNVPFSPLHIAKATIMHRAFQVQICSRGGCRSHTRSFCYWLLLLPFWLAYIIGVEGVEPLLLGAIHRLLGSRLYLWAAKISHATKIRGTGLIATQWLKVWVKK